MPRLALLLLLFAPAVARADAPAIRESFDLRYFPGREARHTLDVFAPKDVPADKAPVVFFVHGGSWMAGDKNFRGTYRNIGRALARGGVVAVLINYRLSPGVKHPEHIRDVARAFAWVHRHIDRYGGDPTRIILSGHSSGAHLAALLAADPSYLEAKELKLDAAAARKGIRGVVPICGVYRIPQGEELNGIVADVVDLLVPSTGKVGMATLLGPAMRGVGRNFSPFRLAFGTDAGVLKQASPITHVRAGLPPFLLINSEAEVPGLPKMADDFEAALKAKKVPVERRTIDDVDHRSIIRELHRTDSDVTKALLAFVKKHAPAPAKGTRP